MKYYFVSISSSNGNITGTREVTKTQFDSADPNPVIQFGNVTIPVEAKNPKDAQKDASRTFTGMKDRIQ